MKAYSANLMNAGVLIAMGLWGYFSAITPSKTALIPVGFGALFLLMHPFMKKDNKVVAHIVVLLTLLLVIMLAAKPLMAAINDGRTMAIVRLAIMIIAGIIAMFSYIKSFKDARKAKNAARRIDIYIS